MASGYRSFGVDFDDLFDPYVVGTSPPATGYRVAGVDLAGRYAPLVYGSQRANVGYRIASGADVATLWAAKGTARYLAADCGLPRTIYGQSNGTSAPLTSSCGFGMHRDGTTAWALPNGSGAWAPLGGATVGDQYEVMFTLLTSNLEGVLSAALGQWLSLSSSRGASLSVVQNTQGETAARRDLRVEIRSVGGPILATSFIYLEAIADIS